MRETKALILSKGWGCRKPLYDREIICDGLVDAIGDYQRFPRDGGFSRAMRKMAIWHSSYLCWKHFSFPGITFYHRFDSRIKKLATRCPDLPLVVVEELTCGSKSKAVISHIRHLFPKAKIIYQMLNPYSMPHHELADNPWIEDLYDGVVTITPEECVKYGWYYHEAPFWPCTLSFDPETVPIKYDIFFIGQDKGRLNFLAEIADSLASMGVSCNFKILGANERINRPGLFYLDSPQSYEATIRDSLQARCILDLPAPGVTYTTSRPLEAIAYGRLLLTTNRNITQQTWYDPDSMFVFEKPNDIKEEWLVNRPLPDSTRYGLLDEYIYDLYREFVRY